MAVEEKKWRITQDDCGDESSDVDQSEDEDIKPGFYALDTAMNGIELDSCRIPEIYECFENVAYERSVCCEEMTEPDRYPESGRANFEDTNSVTS